MMLEKANQIAGQLTAWRREFHSHPELGFQENRTSAYVAEVLESLRNRSSAGYRVQRGIGKTGVVAEIGEGDPVVAIRADMDALPILEANQVLYASQNPGVMHACGHDAHTAIALGVAKLLADKSFTGRVRFIFQPAEEVSDEEGVSGAPRMIADGAMDQVQAVLALHVDAALPVGEVSVGGGPSSAGVDSFYATLIGRGGHGAAPHKVVDPIYIAGHVILGLHGIVSRRLKPDAPAVVSIGSIHAGQATNVIPEEVKLSGTIRYMDNQVQEKIHAEIERAMSIARALGGEYELKFEIGYPPMYNDPEIVALIKEAAGQVLSPEQVKPPRMEMGAEDFSFLSKIAPGAMFSLGSRIECDERKHHSPRFDIDERCLPIGAAILAQAALNYLESAQ
jgi:amidohydrolase